MHGSTGGGWKRNVSATSPRQSPTLQESRYQAHSGRSDARPCRRQPDLIALRLPSFSGGRFRSPSRRSLVRGHGAESGP
jgi:hypothetical protein